jgi:hypothetical protein
MITPKLKSKIYNNFIHCKIKTRKYEYIFAQDPKLSYLYAKDILKARFELGEYSIAKDPYYSLYYAAHILKNRFPQGEPVIKNSKFKKIYELAFNCKL